MYMLYLYPVRGGNLILFVSISISTGLGAVRPWSIGFWFCVGWFGWPGDDVIVCGDGDDVIVCCCDDVILSFVRVGARGWLIEICWTGQDRLRLWWLIDDVTTVFDCSWVIVWVIGSVLILFDNEFDLLIWSRDRFRIRVRLETFSELELDFCSIKNELGNARSEL